MAYYPNASSSGKLESQCDNCVFGDKACPIFAAQIIFNYEVCNDTKGRAVLDSIVSDEHGCMMFHEFGKELKKPVW